MEKLKYKNIDDVIAHLQKIKEEHGNLPIMNEYDADFWIGGDISVSTEKDPDEYQKKIKVVFLR